MSLTTPDYLGVITQGQREPDAFPAVLFPGHQGRTMQTFERLRKISDTPCLLSAEVPELAQKAFALAMFDYVRNDIHGLWYEPESGDGHNPEEMSFVIGSRFAALCEMYGGNEITSPIEHQLGAAILWLNVNWAGFPSVDFMCGPDDHKKTFGESEGLCFYVTPQALVKGHRVDFLVWFQLGKHFGGVSIECDGHNFHEKTKEQVARDKKRDRELLGAGFPAVRFSGSEIHKDVMACKANVEDLLNDILYRVSKDGGLF